ncbi:hypothetical protein [Streptomyces sp.]|uniref:hypothetical protein n=1 Tax=Streptomyces sp. TaxID=1931 RepID=UPI002D74EA3F|nr:hypothetical protein [Streptomyces sp.]HZF88720.1 hypothetical protein [Streptomyces sp.]
MTRPAWRDLLEHCGLHVLEDTAAHHGPPVLSAIRAVAGVETEPTATIPLTSPDATAEPDRAWHLHATDATLYDAGGVGEFLTLPAGSGTTGTGWVHVRDATPAGPAGPMGST